MQVPLCTAFEEPASWLRACFTREERPTLVLVVGLVILFALSMFFTSHVINVLLLPWEKFWNLIPEGVRNLSDLESVEMRLLLFK